MSGAAAPAVAQAVEPDTDSKKRHPPPAPAHKPNSKKWWWGVVIVEFDDAAARLRKGEKDAWCLGCGKELSYGSSTGNLEKHVNKKHADWAPHGLMKQHLVPSGELQDAIIRWMVTTCKPLSEVENEAFRSMMLAANPRAVVPSREKVCRLLDSKEHIAREGARMLLENQHVAITSDIWTSFSQEPYISLTTHHLDADFDLVLLPLECSFFSGSHTAQRILHKTEQMLARSSISEQQVTTMVIDNAANAQLAGSLASFDSMPCAAHTLQLTVKQVLEQPDIAALLRKVRKIVGAFKHSALKVQELKDEQKRLGLNLRKLLQDVVTRWNSVYLMIDVFLDDKPAVEVVCLRHKDRAGNTKRARIAPSSAATAAPTAAPTAAATTSAAAPVAAPAQLIAGVATGTYIYSLLALLQASYSSVALMRLCARSKSRWDVR